MPLKVTVTQNCLGLVSFVPCSYQCDCDCDSEKAKNIFVLHLKYIQYCHSHITLQKTSEFIGRGVHIALALPTSVGCDTAVLNQAKGHHYRASYLNQICTTLFAEVLNPVASILSQEDIHVTIRTIVYLDKNVTIYPLRILCSACFTSSR